MWCLIQTQRLGQKCWVPLPARHISLWPGGTTLCLSFPSSIFKCENDGLLTYRLLLQVKSFVLSPTLIGQKISYLSIESLIFWISRLGACSHEPGTVNYPGVMIAPGQALPRVHMMICCPGATLPRVNFIAPGQVHFHLITTNLSEFYYSFYTNCYREWILNTFTYFWCFLELFIAKFIPNIKNEHVQDCSCPVATFAFCSHGEKLPRQSGLPGVGQLVTCLSKLPKTHVNSYRRQTVHRGKVDPGVSKLARGNELSRDHVNRPSLPRGNSLTPGLTLPRCTVWRL